jgi:hypothetical protein
MTNCFQQGFSCNTCYVVRSCGVIVGLEIDWARDEGVMGDLIGGARIGEIVRLMVSDREMGFWNVC